MMHIADIETWCARLSTPRMVLEPTAPHHAPGMFALLTDARLYELIEDDPPQSIETLADHYAASAPRCSPDGREGWYEWVLVVDREPIGYAQATVYLAEDEIGLAYVLGSAFWGRGYATEACAAVIARLETMPGLRRFYIDTDVENRASQRIAEKLGFRREGIRPGASIIRGQSRDDVRYVRTLMAPSPRA
jgi:ribosomal-protein-alanine N-acetyltransferase